MRWRRQSDREFMRELILRSQRSEREHRRAIDALIVKINANSDALIAMMDASFRELQASSQAMRAEIEQFRRESHEEHEDHRRALLAILDQLGRGGSPA